MTETLLQLAARRGEEYLAGVDDRPVRATATGDALRAALGGPLALAGEDPRRVIEALAAAGITGTVATQGPRYFGFVVGGSVPAATAAISASHRRFTLRPSWISSSAASLSDARKTSLTTPKVCSTAPRISRSSRPSSFAIKST